MLVERLLALREREATTIPQRLDAFAKSDPCIRIGLRFPLQALVTEITDSLTDCMHHPKRGSFPQKLVCDLAVAL